MWLVHYACLELQEAIFLKECVYEHEQNYEFNYDYDTQSWKRYLKSMVNLKSLPSRFEKTLIKFVVLPDKLTYSEGISSKSCELITCYLSDRRVWSWMIIHFRLVHLMQVSTSTNVFSSLHYRFSFDDLLTCTHSMAASAVGSY